MASEITCESESETRRNEILLSYVEAIQDGREPDRDSLVSAHPDLQHDLLAFFADHDELERLTSPLRARDRVRGRSSSSSGGRSSDSAMAIGELGDFRLLREVGRGGMGVVYEAEQISLRRRVALKVLPSAAAIDPRRLQRFKTEALAAAQVQHEKIVPVHAVGCDQGVHYYAMHFVDGQSLAQAIDVLRRAEAEGNPRCTQSSEKPEQSGDPTRTESTGISLSESAALLPAMSLLRDRALDRAVFRARGRIRSSGGAGA